MTIGSAPLTEFRGRTSDIERVYRAASNAGNAGAMATNLFAAGRHTQAELWQGEQEAWLQRKDELIDQAPLAKQWLSDYAAQITCDVFISNVVEKLS